MNETETDRLHKLNKLYAECISELSGIGIDILDEEKIGKIDIGFSNRKVKRYGCCKNENPDKSTAYRAKRKIYYRKFNTHHIEISDWLMDLNDDIIKNTIVHELIHCMPDCNNHGKDFKRYAQYINLKLGYNISRVGNKEEDYKKSNIEFSEVEKKPKFNYKITCLSCGYTFYRMRLQRNFARKYRCGKCMGKLIIADI
ncbi:MAG: SprT-like domain-containing protein [Clostridia bacterium]|nr:SprT-like domain-containing protein [Clostridia bacterium]